MFEKIKLQIKYLIYKISCKNINNCNIISDLGMILREVDKIKCDKLPKCNMQKLSKKTDGFTKINGQSLPGTLATLVDSKVLLDICNAYGQRVYIVKSIRKAGTRVGIHVHKYGGYTLILKGTMTDFVQGKPNKTYNANSGYYMPPCTPMSAANLGSEDVELIDIFIGKPGEAFISVLEPNWTFNREGIFSLCN